MIQQLWKTEVYAMSNWLCENELIGLAKTYLEQCIICNATDGLGIMSSDLDQVLPDWKDRYDNTKDGYAEVDEIFIEHFLHNTLMENSIPIQRYKMTMFKRNHPVNIYRKDIIK